MSLGATRTWRSPRICTSTAHDTMRTTPACESAHRHRSDRLAPPRPADSFRRHDGSLCNDPITLRGVAVVLYGRPPIGPAASPDTIRYDCAAAGGGEATRGWVLAEPAPSAPGARRSEMTRLVERGCIVTRWLAGSLGQRPNPSEH
eukprot:gene12540-11637_t